MSGNEDDILEWFAEAFRDIKRPPVPPSRRQPRTTAFHSPRQRVGLTQSSNFTRAVYNPDTNPTPVRRDSRGLTLEVGPGDEFNPPRYRQRQGR